MKKSEGIEAGRGVCLEELGPSGVHWDREIEGLGWESTTGRM